MKYQTAAGFIYFKLPSGVSKLEKLRIEVAPSEEISGNKLEFVLPLPTIDLTAPVAQRVAGPETKSENPTSN